MREPCTLFRRLLRGGVSAGSRVTCSARLRLDLPLQMLRALPQLGLLLQGGLELALQISGLLSSRLPLRLGRRAALGDCSKGRAEFIRLRTQRA